MMAKVGELVLYLRGEAERLLNEIETALKLLPKDPSVKKGAEVRLKELYTGLRRSVQTLQREKNVPDTVIVELQIDVKRVADILEDVKKIDLQKSNLEKVKNTLLQELEAAREILRLVESGLVELEKGLEKRNK